ncbi:MAG TPA: DUF2243 domain-containing protein [Bryobacteraceae bacterium]|nr:DUF2243 domain-containing protein [Bryobacteraceae bacterium]
MNPRPLIAAGTLLGIGMGGFLDGIVFHQILQLHNMLTGIRPKVTLADAEINMFWDGLFHALTWLMTAFGIMTLFKAGGRSDVPWSGKALFGSMLMGWGGFNFVEGLIDHNILGIHHVVESAGLSIFDHLFLASGVLLVLAGWTQTRGILRRG